MKALPIGIDNDQECSREKAQKGEKRNQKKKSKSQKHK
jgi:hypothetical protein